MARPGAPAPSVRIAGFNFLVAVALLAASGCAFSAEGELPDVEVTQHGVEFAATPRGAGEGSMSVTITQQKARFGLPRNALSAVVVKEVALTATSGVDDLDFLRTVRVSVTTAERKATGAPATLIATYERVAEGDNGLVIAGGTTPPADILDAWKADTRFIIVDVTGRLPGRAWTGDVSVRCWASLNLAR